MVLVFAGPNGSGKSTITQYFEKVGEYTNADDIVPSTLTRAVRDLVQIGILQEERIGNEIFIFRTLSIMVSKAGMNIFVSPVVSQIRKAIAWEIMKLI